MVAKNDAAVDFVILGLDKVRGIDFIVKTEKWEIGGRQPIHSLSFFDLQLSFKHRLQMN